MSSPSTPNRRLLMGVIVLAALLGTVAVLRFNLGGVAPTSRQGSVAVQTAETVPNQTGEKAGRADSGPVLVAGKEGAYSYRTNIYDAGFDSGRVDFSVRLGAGETEPSTWAYELADIRMGDRVIAQGGKAFALRRDASTVYFLRGDVEEEYIVRPESMEQTFIVKELPEPKGAITVSGRVLGNLEGPAEGTRADRLQFRHEKGPGISVSDAVAIDAAGRRLPLDLVWVDGRMSMTVPAEWVEQATLPIRIDPVVGSAFTIGTGLTWQGSWRTRVAYASGPDEYMVVWSDHPAQGAPFAVYAQRLSATGALLGSRITVSTTNINSFNPSIVYCAGLNEYMVVWIKSVTTTYTISGRGITAAGAFVGPEFDLAFSSNMNYTALATDGVSQYFAAVSDIGISGALFNRLGTLQSFFGIQLQQTGVIDVPAAAYSNGEYLVAWTEANSLMARGLNTSGTMLTPVTTVATTVGYRSSDVSAGNNQFLVTWLNNPSGIYGRVIQADSASTLAFGTPVFPIATSSIYYAWPSVCYAGILGQWVVPHNDGQTPQTQSIKLNLASSSGTSGADQAVTVPPPGVSYPKCAWNSTLGEVLMVYEVGTEPNIVLTGIRYSLPIPPGIPTGVAATPGNAQVTVNWLAVSGATSYNVKQATTSTGPFTTVGSPTTNTYLNTGLTSGKTYWYVVSAINGVGESGNSSPAVSATLTPDVPTGVGVIPGNTQVTLNWPAVSGATSYNVKRGAASGGPFTTVGSPTTNTFLNNTGLTNGTTYWYVVSAVNSGGESGNSSPAVSATPVAPPGVPTGVVTIPGNAQVTINWTAVSGATSYNVKRGPASGGPFTTVGSPTTNTFLNNTGLTNGTTYWYVVSALNGVSESANSTPAVSATPVVVPGVPTGVATFPGNAQVTVNWTAVSGATSYNVKRGTASGGPFTTVGSPTTNSFLNNTGLTNGTTYWYVVSAVNAGGESANSSPSVSASPFVPTFAALFVVGNTTLGVGDAAVQARLQALGYAVTVKLDSASVTGDATGKNIVVVSSTVTSANVNTKFQAVAVPVLVWESAILDDMGMTSGTGLGTTTGQTQIVIAAAGHPMAAGLTGTVAVTTAADAYTWGLPNANAVKVATLATDATKSVIFGYDSGAVMPGLTAPARRVGFFFGDTSANILHANGGSLFTAAVQWVTAAAGGPPAIPTGLLATSGNQSITLNWSAALGATKYSVKKASVGGGPYTLITPPVTGLTWTDSGLTNGATFFYVVRAENLAGNSADSFEVAGLAGSFPPAPTGLTATAASSTSIALSWTAAGVGTTYNVKWALAAAGPYTTLTPAVSGTLYTHTGRISNTTYYYVVSATNATGEGPNSSVAFATPPSIPVAVVATAVAGNQQVTLSWPAVPRATTYNVKRSSNAGGGAPYTSISGTLVDTTFIDTQRTNGTAYYYVVSAQNVSGEGPNSAQVSATPSGLPLPPTGLAAVAGNAKVLLTWTSNGASYYTIKRGTTNGGPYPSNLGTTTFSSFLDPASLINGTTYYYILTATTASGESQPTAQVPATPIAPPATAPTALTAVGLCGNVRLTWTALAGATSYTVKRSSVSGGPYTPIQTGVTAATYTNNGLPVPSTWYYVVSAVNTGGEGPNSAQVSGTTVAPPATPTGVTAKPGAGPMSVTLTWNAVSGAVFYNIFYRNTPNTGAYFLGLQPTGTSATLSVGTGTWYFIVEAVNNGGESPISNQVSATTVAVPNTAPTLSAATARNSSVDLSWTAVSPPAGSAGMGYTVRRGTVSGTYTQTFNVPVGQTTYRDTTPVNGTPYFYVVAATDEGGIGPNSNQVSATPLSTLVPAAPLNLTATRSPGHIILNWTAPPGTGLTYKVGPPGFPIATVSTTTYDATGLTDGTVYTYSIVATNSVGDSANSASVQARAGVPVAPTLTATAGPSSVKLTWTSAASTGAAFTNYTVKRGLASAGPFDITILPSDIAALSVVDFTAVNGTTYWYVVSARDEVGTGPNSTSKSAIPSTSGLEPFPPTSLTAVGGNAQVSLSWPAVSGATGYLVQRGTTSGGPYGTSFTAPSPSYVDTTVTNTSPPTSYFYVVKSTAPGGNSVSTSPQATGIPMAPPTGVVALAGDGQVTISWASLSGATGYNIKRSTVSGGPYTLVYSAPNSTGTVTSGVDTSAINNTAYFYVVTVNYINGESTNSLQVTATPKGLPTAPTNLTATAGSNKVDLSWIAPYGTNTYTIKRATVHNGPYSAIQTGVAGSTFSDTTAINNTRYYYVVCAVNSYGAGPDSNEATALPILVAPNITTVNGKRTKDTTPVLTGGGPANATIRVYFNGVDDGSTATANGTGAWTYDNAVHAPYGDATYTVTATATVGVDTSPPSASISLTVDTKVNPPLHLTATPKNGAIDLEWTASPDPDVIGYRIYRSTTLGGTYTVPPPLSASQVIKGTKYRDGNPPTTPLTGGPYFYKVSAVDGTSN